MPAAVSIPTRSPAHERNASTNPNLGSPMSFKTIASLSKGFRTGLSPGMSFGSLEQKDEKMVACSVESESSRLMKALSASQPRAERTLGDFLNPAAGENEFCRDFTCCGLVLDDLHALVEHFEDVHVRVVPSEFPFPTSAQAANGQSPAKPSASAADDMDMEMDEDAASPSSSGSTPPHTPLARNVTSAFETTSVFLPYRRTSDFGPPSLYATSASIIPKPPTLTGRSTQTPGIQPALLVRTPDLTPQPSPPGTPTTATSKQLPSTTRRGGIQTPTRPNAATDPRPPLPGGKPFRCPTPNCTKSYKQANGLKYHMTHGQCSFLPPDPVLETLTDKEADERMRPFVCAVGANSEGKGGGCGRRYKNMNGLRYHYQHSGAHGAVGLAMLAAGTHPPPPAWALGLSRSNSIPKSRPESSATTPTSEHPPVLPGGEASIPDGAADAAEDMEMEFA